MKPQRSLGNICGRSLIMSMSQAITVGARNRANPFVRCVPRKCRQSSHEAGLLWAMWTATAPFSLAVRMCSPPLAGQIFILHLAEALCTENATIAHRTPLAAGCLDEEGINRRCPSFLEVVQEVPVRLESHHRGEARIPRGRRACRLDLWQGRGGLSVVVK